VRQPLEEVGREMVTQLLRRMEGQDVRSLVLATELVVRAST
jgi:DNA-binding LacI/PurR family transcriptional regulator